MARIKFALVAAFVALSTAAIAQIAQPVSYLSAASTNSTLVKTGPGQITSLMVGNTNGGVYYLKFYDKAAAPTCGTDTPIIRIIIPGNVSATEFPIAFATALQFINGIGFCLTGGLADNDSTNAATGIAINIGIK